MLNPEQLKKRRKERSYIIKYGCPIVGLKDDHSAPGKTTIRPSRPKTYWNLMKMDLS